MEKKGQTEEIKTILDEIFNKYEYTGIDKQVYDQIAMHTLEECRKSPKILNNFANNLKKILDKKVCEYIHTILEEETSLIRTLNIYIQKEFKPGEETKNIIRIERFCRRFNIELTFDIACNILKSNDLLMQNIKRLVEENKLTITQGQVDTLFHEESIIILIEVYCMLANIQIDEHLEDSTTIIDSLKNAGIDSQTLNTVRLYLNEIRHPLLTPEEEQKLSFIMLNSKSEKEKQEARDKFALSNLRLVIKIAKKYLKTRIPFEDLIQLGNEGLLKAIDRFDYKKGFKFSTYAIHWIRQNIQRGIANEGRVVRIPVHQTESLIKITKIIENLTYELGHNPSNKEIEENTDLTQKQIEFFRYWYSDIGSLNVKVNDDVETEFEEFVASDINVESEVVDNSLGQALMFALENANIRLRDQNIIKYRFRIGEKNADLELRTLEEVGATFDISHERVRQIEEHVFRNLIRYRGRDLLPYLSNQIAAEKLIKHVKSNPQCNLFEELERKKPKYKVNKDKNIYQLLHWFKKEDIDFIFQYRLNDDEREMLYKRCINRDLNTCSGVKLTDDENRKVKLLTLKMKNMLIKVAKNDDNRPQMIEIDKTVREEILSILTDEFKLISEIMSSEEAIIIALSLGYTKTHLEFDDESISLLLKKDLNIIKDIINKKSGTAKKYIMLMKQTTNSDILEKKNKLQPLNK